MGPQPVYVPGQGSVLTAPSVVQVPVSYSVTRYIRATPDVRAEESGGEFMFHYLR